MRNIDFRSIFKKIECDKILGKGTICEGYKLKIQRERELIGNEKFSKPQATYGRNTYFGGLFRALIQYDWIGKENDWCL